MTVPADNESKARRISLSILVQGKYLVLNEETFSVSFAQLFPESLYKGLKEGEKARCERAAHGAIPPSSEEGKPSYLIGSGKVFAARVRSGESPSLGEGVLQSLIGRLGPLSSPKSVLVADSELLSFLRIELAGISADRAFEDAFATKCFHTVVAQPDSRAAFLWHCTHQATPIDSKEWSSLPNLQRFYGLLPLLKNLKIQQLLPEHPVLQEELSYEQLQKAWIVWLSFFEGCLISIYVIYQQIKEIVSKDLPYRAQKFHLSKRHQNRELRKSLGHVFKPEKAAAFLAKWERLEAFLRKKFPFLRQRKGRDELGHLLQQNPILWRAEIFDRIHPMIQLLSEISELSREMGMGIIEQRMAFEGKIRKETPASITAKDAYAETIEEFDEVFLTASVVVLLSDALCAEIRKYLDRTIGGSKEGRVFQRAEDAIRRTLAYQACILEDVLDPFEEEKSDPQEKRPVRKNESQKRSESQPAFPPKESPCTLVEPQITALDSLKRQLDVDFEHLKNSPRVIGSMAPFAATLAQYIETQAHFPEIGDHLFLMAQGIELFLQCAQAGQRALLPVIFRAVLVDFHVAVEQKCVYEILSSGRSNPHLHDLATLAQAGGLVLSETQRQFLQDANLALYWARYPDCSRGYFAYREKPRLLQMLLDISEHKNCISEAFSELCSLYQRALELLIPPEAPIERLTTWLQCASVESTASSEAPLQDHPLLLMRNSIQETLRTCCYIGESLTRPLREILYYLSWIHQAQILQDLYPDTTLRFWHQRNALEVEKLFKHLYAADRLLCDGEEIRSHQISFMIEALEGIRSFDGQTRRFLRSFNMRTALHYHTHSSPMREAYLNLLRECQLQVHGFTSGEKALLSWPFFGRAIALFQEHVQSTLEKLKTVDAEIASAHRCANS